MRTIRYSWLELLLAFAFVGSAAANATYSLELPGFVAARGSWVSSPPSWLDRGFGRFTVGADGPDDSDFVAAGELELALDWRPSDSWRFYVHGSLLAEPREDDKFSGGLVEAYVELGRERAGGGRWRLRLGPQILPTSRENIDALWVSPYTLTGSAINAWIAEEIRPTAVDAEGRWKMNSGHRFRLGASVFYGNDASGALLAWRGWSMHSRLSRWGEVLPLPPIDSLATGGPFADQRSDGTEPFGRDLDGDPGWSARARWTTPSLFLVQATYYDNGGDQRLYRGEYAWSTDFLHLGMRFTPSERWTVLAEGLSGSTGMGFGRVDTDISAIYLLISVELGAWRYSLRRDDFRVEDVDRGGYDDNEDSGSAWTLAVFWTFAESFRLGLESVDVDGQDRGAAIESGLEPSTSGRTLQLEIRWSW